jgi:transcriptional regulator
MLEQPLYALNDPADIRSLIADRAWATLVSPFPNGGLTVSHLPVVLDPDRDDSTVLGHLARTDAELHELGRHPVVLIIEGPNGYISPSFYQSGPYVPTWNFVVAHLHGTPELLGAQHTYDVLDKTVDHFESRRPNPWHLAEVDEYAQHIAPMTAGFRLAPTRTVGKAKVSQEKPRDITQRVIQALERDDDIHNNRELAATMTRILPPSP